MQKRKKETKKRTSRSDPSRSVGRTTSGSGDAGAAVGAVVEMHAVEAQADLSSLSLSDVKHWNVLEVKKKIKRRGAVCLVWRRKTRKRKKKKRNETWMKMKWKEEK